MFQNEFFQHLLFKHRQGRQRGVLLLQLRGDLLDGRIELALENDVVIDDRHDLVEHFPFGRRGFGSLRLQERDTECQ